MTVFALPTVKSFLEKQKKIKIYLMSLDLINYIGIFIINIQIYQRMH